MYIKLLLSYFSNKVFLYSWKKLNVGVAYQDVSVFSDETLIQRLLNRPAILLLLIYLGIAIPFIQQVGTNVNIPLFVLFFLFPVIPALYFEAKWASNVSQKNPNAINMYNLVKKHRWTFILGGFVLGFIEFIVGIFLKFLLIVPSGDNSLNVPIDQARNGRVSAIFVYTIVICFIAIYTSASFYRIRAEDLSSGKRYNYLSSPAQIATFLSYAYIGVNFHFTFLWMGHYLNVLRQNLTGPDVDHFYGAPLEFISSGIISPLLMMNFLFFVVGIYAAAAIPKYISGSLYRKLTRSEMRMIAIKFLLIAVVSTFLLQSIFGYAVNSSNYSRLNLFQMIILAFTTFAMIYLGGTMKYTGAICKTCNLLKNEEEQCYSCDINEETDQQFRISVSRNLTYPYCPSCGMLWKSLSRKCQNIKCNFTIVLSCNKCAQTLNPLWEECNVCGEKRDPIPQVALKSPGSPGYARNQSFLMLFLTILIPALILQIVMATSVYRRVAAGLYDKSLLNSMFDDLARIIILSVTVFSALYIIIASLNEDKKAIMQVANRVATVPGSVTILSSIVFLTVLSFTHIFTDLTGIIFNIILLGMSLLLTISSLYNYYKSLIQFRPIVGFDPLVAFDQAGE